MEIQGEKEIPMRAVSLLYHDVVKKGEPDASGFPGLHAGRYKLDCEDFERHIAELRHAAPSIPVTVMDVLTTRRDHPFMLTFDDGGVSAYTYIADVLDRYGWKAHFLITTDFIGHASFVNAQQIRELKKRGHIIGSHSCSHPDRMAFLTSESLLREWRTSVSALSDVLGEKVIVASVPGGSYSSRVADAADRAGIRALFTSEPITRTRQVGACSVFGRYTVWRGMAPNVSAGFASGRGLSRPTQWMFWNSKKIIKAAGGKRYADLISFLLKHLNREGSGREH
jgi:peptidoglycan/xylan/chitin deacetylase (PgdA/CDA1 family)